jgi:VWFA-related protein
VKRTVASLVALALLPRSGFGQDPAIPAFPTQADAITADVVVLDKDDRPVRGLTRGDFTLLADGKPQAVVAFEARELATALAVPAAPVGEERVATNEDGASRGRTFAFLLDDLGTQHFTLQDAKKAIRRWLEERAEPTDEVTLATVSGDLWWSDRVDRGRGDLLEVLDRVKTQGRREHGKEWISDFEAYRIAEDATLGVVDGGPSNPDPNPDMLSSISDRVSRRTGLSASEVHLRAIEVYNDLQRRTQALLHASERLSRGLAGARGRKSILIFSDGLLYDPNERLLFDRSIDASQRGNTALYFVGLKGLTASALFRAEDPNGVAGLQDGRPDVADLGVRSMEGDYFDSSGTEMVAENTGGTSIRDTNDLLGGLVKIAEESSTYYLLGYQPEKAPDGKWHKLEVKVARPGVKVRTRHGYQATPPPDLALVAPVAKAKDGDQNAPKRPIDPAVMTSGAADAIPLRIASYVLDADKSSLARILVVLELDTKRLSLRSEGERRTGAVDLTLLGMSRDQAKTFPLDERVRIDLDAKAAGGWMSLTRELRLPAGVAQVRALVRDVGSGLGGTVTQRLEVPPLDAPYLATPIVTDRMIMARGGGARLVPVAYRRFRPKGHLYCSYEVLGMTTAKGEATTHVTGGFTLRAAGGQIVRQASPTPIAVALGGKVMRLFALPLSGLDAGEYDLVLDVVDEGSGRTLQSHEAFVLEPSAT